MSKNRLKKSQALVLTDRGEAESHVNLVADLVNSRRAVAAEMDREILEIKQKNELQLAQYDFQIKNATDDLEAWALANPMEFHGRKSIDFLAGAIGFRTGMPSLRLLKGWKWDDVLEAIQDKAFQFIRTKAEVDKEAIISFVTTSEDKEAVKRTVLDPIGVSVKQGEAFFVEPKLTEEAV